MQKLIFTLAISLMATITMAQCTPGANFSDSLFGAWPDTTENLPGAAVNIPYSTTLNFKVPLYAADVVDGLTGTIQNFIVNNVTGLPAGLSYACNNASCTFNGGSTGCAQISGTPTMIGTYPVTIEVTGNINIGFGVVIPAPYTFSGYRIIVGTAGISEFFSENLTITPNPVKDKLTVNGLKSSDNVAIYAVDGTLLLSQDGSENTTLDFDCSALKTGVYLLKCTSDKTTQSIRFLKD